MTKVLKVITILLTILLFYSCSATYVTPEEFIRALDDPTYYEEEETKNTVRLPL